jgi:hypothetical protein
VVDLGARRLGRVLAIQHEELSPRQTAPCFRRVVETDRDDPQGGKRASLLRTPYMELHSHTCCWKMCHKRLRRTANSTTGARNDRQLAANAAQPSYEKARPPPVLTRAL